MSEPAPAIAAPDLTKRSGPVNGESTVLAVDRINFHVRPGEVFGFLGPNRAADCLPAVAAPLLAGGAGPGGQRPEGRASIHDRLGVLFLYGVAFLGVTAWVLGRQEI